MSKEPKFNLGDTVAANIYGKIGSGRILEFQFESLTKSFRYYVLMEFAGNYINKMWIYEDSLTKVDLERLKDLCINSKVDYNNALSFKVLYPELTDEQVIIHFRPDCYINILGELVLLD